MELIFHVQPSSLSLIFVYIGNFMAFLLFYKPQEEKPRKTLLDEGQTSTIYVLIRWNFGNIEIPKKKNK